MKIAEFTKKIATSLLMALAIFTVCGQAASADIGNIKDPVHHCSQTGESTEDYTDWDIVEFGMYPQTNITGMLTEKEIISISNYACNNATEKIPFKKIYVKIYQNGFFKWEPIKWRVLCTDSKNGKVLLVSDKILDYRLYNDPSNLEYSYQENYRSWDQSSLRKYLNDTSDNRSFINRAFDDSQKAAISSVNNNDTGNEVFILKISDIINGDFGLCLGNDTSATTIENLRFKISDFAKNVGLLEEDVVYGEYILRRDSSNTYNNYPYISATGKLNDSTGHSLEQKSGVVPAMWLDLNKLTYDINYYLEGGSNNSSNPLKHSAGKEVTLKEPTKEGYDFLGWYYLDENENKVFTSTINAGILKDVDIYAMWQNKEYKINYVLNGGQAGVGNPTEYTYNNGVASLTNPTKEHSTFMGWFTEAEFVNQVTGISSAMMGDVTLYAKWKGDMSNITYDLNGGTNSGSNPATYEYGVGVATLAEALKPGYKFLGWYTDAALTNLKTSISITDFGNITLYAKWGCLHNNKKEVLAKTASDKRDGEVQEVCQTCNEVVNTNIIPRAYITVYDTVAYTGKALKPAVKVTDKAGKAIPKTCYTLTYKNNKKVGKAFVTINFKGNYAGQVKKSFVIAKKSDIPAKVSGLEISAKSKAFSISWKELSVNCSGYEIWYSTDKNFLTSVGKKKISSASTLSTEIKKLKAGKTYYVKMRAFTKSGNVTLYSSAWTASKKVKVK